MRGLEKNCIRWPRQTDRQTSRHRDSMTDPAEWGQVSDDVYNCRKAKAAVIFVVAVFVVFVFFMVAYIVVIFVVVFFAMVAFIVFSLSSSSSS